MTLRFGWCAQKGLLALLALTLLLTGSLSARAADNPKVTISVENRGDIVLELYQADAPKNRRALSRARVNKKFYDGILFSPRPSRIYGAGRRSHNKDADSRQNP